MSRARAAPAPPAAIPTTAPAGVAAPDISAAPAEPPAAAIRPASDQVRYRRVFACATDPSNSPSEDPSQ
jgi:hypothetical protein